ncbi:hypothetical protein FYJ27_08525 [Anaerosalibacter bizertensis]|uniref:Uncharacterized protein n=1 Tax=Anaerosalibacter bizertensis TaxID=932217 RepID=A0A844FII7_9FIRM|nr:hypothetical protein [Anaerosalibacter bizertensis]MSS43771.1 hypothetical protein [Anaerosalibacter bizertensis]
MDNKEIKFDDELLIELEEDEIVSIDFTLDEVDSLIEELLKIEKLLKNGTKYIKEKYEDTEDGDFYIRLHKNRIELIEDTIVKFMKESQSWG